MISETFKQVKSLFIWQCDTITFGVPEHWKSFADEVEQGKVFRGDCDNFALTCAELLVRKGMDPAMVRLSFCQVPPEGWGHLVCVAKDHKGKDMVLDNRQRGVWHWTQIRYNWISSMRLDEPGVWRDAG